MITIQQLKGICPTQTKARLSVFIQSLNEILPEYEINTALRVQHFIAQAAHETASFNYLTELASGANYDVGAKAKALGNTPENDGDGEFFKGRGIFQTTGKSNYRAVSLHLFNDERLLQHPELLTIPENAVCSAAYYWQSHNLNELADKDDVVSITKRINGGLNGLDDRKDYLLLAKKFIQ